MEIEEFKMEVTPEQSKIVQKRLFELGVYWRGCDYPSIREYVNNVYFYVYRFFDEPLSITHNNEKDYFKKKQKHLKELKFEEFKEKYMKRTELPKYYIIKRSDSPLWKKYITWMNDTHDEMLWNGDNWLFYGYDGGVACDNYIRNFKNNPEIITLEEWDDVINKKTEKNMELKITRERVLETSENHPETRKILETLFPEVFDVVIVDKNSLKTDIEVREDFEYQNKAYWLNPKYSWEIKEDSNRVICLIPTVKNK